MIQLIAKASGADIFGVAVKGNTSDSILWNPARVVIFDGETVVQSKAKHRM